MEARLPQSRSTSLGSTPRSTSRLLLLDSPRTRRLRLEFAGTPDVMPRPALLALAGAALFIAPVDASVRGALRPPCVRAVPLVTRQLPREAPSATAGPGRSRLST